MEFWSGAIYVGLIAAIYVLLFVRSERARVDLDRLIERAERRYPASSSNTSSFWMRVSRVSTDASRTSSYYTGYAEAEARHLYDGSGE